MRYLGHFIMAHQMIVSTRTGTEIMSRPSKPSPHFSFCLSKPIFSERQPLLSNQGTSKHQSYLQPSSYNHLIISAQSPAQSSSTWHSTVAPRLHDLGWIEYHLPDGTFYYVHPTRRVTTDINLRTEKMLSAVTSFFDEHKDSAGAPVGAELWLRDIGNTKRGFIPLRCWVDHHSRAVIMDRVHHPGKGKRVAEDDRQPILLDIIFLH